MTYAEYLQSETLARLRARRIELDRGMCVCGEPARQVHHKRYPAILGRERVDDLVSLCDACHGKKHGIVTPRDRVVFGKNVRHVSEVISADAITQMCLGR